MRTIINKLVCGCFFWYLLTFKPTWFSRPPVYRSDQLKQFGTEETVLYDTIKNKFEASKDYHLGAALYLLVLVHECPLESTELLMDYLRDDIKTPKWARRKLVSYVLDFYRDIENQAVPESREQKSVMAIIEEIQTLRV